MRKLLTALALSAAVFAGPAGAQQDVVAAVASLDQVARGLEAQYQAALIRERRLADERESQLIAQYEEQLRAARADFDRGRAGAEAALNEARAQFAAYVNDVAQRDQETRALVDAYRQQLASELDQASPEQRAALERFADGDLEAGFEQYRDESRRRSEARRRVAETVADAARAADARDARQLARMGETMRANGRMTAREVLELFSAAADLDPTHFNTAIRAALLANYVGDEPRRVREAERARAAAQSDPDRIFMAQYDAAFMISRGRGPEAMPLMEEAVATARRYAADRPGDIEAQRILRTTLRIHGVALAADVGRGASRPVVLETLQVAEAVSQRSDATEGDQRELASALAQAARVSNDAEEAHQQCQRAIELSGEVEHGQVQYDVCAEVERDHEHFSEALALAANLETFLRARASDPTDETARTELAFLLSDTASALIGLNRQDEARAWLEESIAIQTVLRDQYPDEVARWQVLGLTYSRLGDVKAALGDQAGALAAYRSGLLVERELAPITRWERTFTEMNAKYVRLLLDVSGPDGARADLSAGGLVQSGPGGAQLAAETLIRIAAEAAESGNIERHAWAAREGMAAADGWAALDGRPGELGRTARARFAVASAERFLAFEDLPAALASGERAIQLHADDGGAFAGEFLAPVERARGLCAAYVARGGALDRLGRRDEAMASYQACVDRARADAERYPTLIRNFEHFGLVAHYELAWLDEEHWPAVLEAAQPLHERFATPWLAEHYPTIEFMSALTESEAARRAGDNLRAASLAINAASIGGAVLSENQDDWWFDKTAFASERAAHALLAGGQPSMAIQTTLVAVGYRRLLYARSPGYPENGAKLAQNLDYVGYTWSEQGRANEALPLLREAWEIRRRFAEAAPDDMAAQWALGQSLESLAMTPGSGVGWSEVVDHLNAMARRGLSNDDTRALLGRAREQAGR